MSPSLGVAASLTLQSIPCLVSLSYSYLFTLLNPNLNWFFGVI